MVITRGMASSNEMKLGVFKIGKIETLKSFPAVQLDEIRAGGKVVFPESVLVRSTRRQDVPSPFIYKITNGTNAVYCGAISFDGDNTKVATPEWMLKQLNAKQGDKINVHCKYKCKLPV